MLFRNWKPSEKNLAAQNFKLSIASGSCQTHHISEINLKCFAFAAWIVLSCKIYFNINCICYMSENVVLLIYISNVLKFTYICTYLPEIILFYLLLRKKRIWKMCVKMLKILKKIVKNKEKSKKILKLVWKSSKEGKKITCPFSKYFQILYIFSQIFKYFAFLCPFLTFFLFLFCPFSEKSHVCPYFLE